jgi:cell division protein FtsQ
MMQNNSMKDHANANVNAKKRDKTKVKVKANVKVNRGATRLEKKEPFSLSLKLPVIPMWILQTVFVVTLLASAGWGMQQVRWGWPVEQVEIEGEFRYWQAEDLAKQLLWVKDENFFSLDVHAVKYELEQLALIKSVQVKKVWPETLLVKFKEDIPVAVWNKETLLNPKGEELILPDSFDISGLPRLSGPEQEIEQVMRQYQRFQARLTSADAGMINLTMNAVGSWQIKLNNGWTIRLGRQQLEQRLDRAIELLKVLPQEKVAVVDLRYGKGAAIKWLPV